MLAPSSSPTFPTTSPNTQPAAGPAAPCDTPVELPLLLPCACHSYSSKLEAAVRGRRGRHFPHMRVIPPGLDFSGLKVASPTGAWPEAGQQQQQQASGPGQLSIPPSPKGAGTGNACTTPTSARALHHCPTAPAADIASRGTWLLHRIILHAC